jgi:N-acyl-D-aspartate/D-glutamate deacylase
MTADLIIRGGTVVDGTGTPARTADVAVRDGRITDVGNLGAGAAARRVIDADGALVTPGFVDIHTHYDGQATWDSRLAPSSWHGVTTVVFGNCGVGFAPVVPDHHDRLIELMEGVEDIPGTALHEGLSWQWRSFADYLDALDAIPHDVDLAAQVPHSALRLHAMGERGAQREPASPDEIVAMAALARDAVLAGALGFTTSRTLNHRTSRGEPTPTLTASSDELTGIALGLREAGRGVLQVVSDFTDAAAEFRMFHRMMSESGRPLSLSLAQGPQGGNSYRRMLDFTSEMGAAGFDMRVQVGARAVGVVLGLRCTLHPFVRNRAYLEYADLPLAERVAVLRDPSVKARILAAQTPAKGSMLDRFDTMFALGAEPDYEPDAASSVAALAAARRVAPADLAYDLLLTDGGEALLYLPVLNYGDGNLDAAGEMLRHPNALPGLSDGGAHVGTICDASFPTTLLAWWCRDRPHDRLPLEYVVQRQARDTAAWVGLDDRGVLAPGYRADINVIDFEALSLHRPEMHYDLPAGGKRLLQRANGYRHTFVAGAETYRDGVATEALPGRLVRGPQRLPLPR